MSSRVGADLENHPKIRHAWSLHHSALGLHLLGLSYAQRTGGFVSTAFVTEKLPGKRERTAAIAALTAIAPGETNPMWSETEGGWRIHNFAKHAEFRSVEEEGELRATRRAAGSKGAAKRWQVAMGPDGNLPDDPMATQNDLPSFAIPFAISDEEEVVVEVKKELQKRTTSSSSKMANAAHLALSERLANAILANDPKAPVAPRSKRWLDATRLLIERDGRTVTEVEAVIDWCQADAFWRSNVLSMDTLRRQFTQLSLKMAAAKPGGRAPRASSPTEPPDWAKAKLARLEAEQAGRAA